MKKGQVYTGIVERVEFPNKGIVRAGEETCVVKNSLPGQKVSFLVNKVRHGKAEARLLEVVESSPLETGEPCSHFGVCGGCTYLSLPYEEQLQIKERQVQKLLERALEGQKEPWQWEGIKGSPQPYGYRNKMEFSFGDEVKDGPLSLGMHKRGSMYDVVHVKDCRIVDEDYQRILGAVLAYFQGQCTSFHHKMRHEGFLRHLLVRKAARTGEILVALVTSSQAPRGGVYGQPGDAEEIVALLEGFRACLLGMQERGELSGVLAGILHISNDSLADVVQGDRTEILYGRDYIYEELLGLRFKISTFSFFQTNTYSAEVLYETAREYVGELGAKEDEADKRLDSNNEDGCRERKRAAKSANWGKEKLLYDLYSGTGTIAQLMAAAAGRVIGVEIVEEAVEAARENAALNGLQNCEFIAGDVLKALDELTEKPDMIILDPPRDGIHPKALPKIIGYGVEKIVYISCKPTSLARDLEAFLEGGYHVERAVAVDQFPWTANVETVVLLSRKNGGNKSSRIEIEIDLNEADRREYIGKATYQEIKDYILKHHQTKVSHLYIAQIKKKCGLDVGENFNKPKTEGNRVPNCPVEKERMIREALEYFGMI